VTGFVQSLQFRVVYVPTVKKVTIIYVKTFGVTPPKSGTLTKFFLHPADYEFKIPDKLSEEERAMIEPLTVAVYACKKSKVNVGKDVQITGTGPIGLLNTMVAKALEANQVLVTNVNEDRLKLAKKIGADHTVLVNRDTKEEKLVNKIKQLFGKESKISIECSGAPSSL
jgi:L-iditol 2-dehydrogenase